MKATEIEVGKTYVNRGAGRTRRKVIAIGNEHRPEPFSILFDKDRQEPGILYEQDGKRRNIYLSGFISWAGREA